MSFTEQIRSSPRLKKFVHWLLIPTSQARPRLWVRIFLNRFFHQRGKNVVIRRWVRMDVLPFNHFSIGDNSMIEDFTTINNGVGDVRIGDNSLVGLGNVIIGPITIGNNVILAQNIVASGLNHNYQNVRQPIHKQGVNMAQITIEDDCWIGANTVITAGVTIGKHSVIAAGSVVTKDVPPYSVAVGNPSRRIKGYDEQQDQWVRV
ncbi:acyltransferase [Dyadobacter sandarakinus]|uniref:Acyltransferase n=1 Tax=Dyadobacter sandarakinus TaxID=2747268 RepID=A0ABX7I1B0_9BACT|nr:acyltransferase [Dyadobacter sandarakinus]QRQ99563.1 acyltransferase [Dyadobacter sandarakinus]